jgi:hypothetical protein
MHDVSRFTYFFILAVPNQFRYPVWGQEAGSLTHRHRRLLTQKRIISQLEQELTCSESKQTAHVWFRWLNRNARNCYPWRTCTHNWEKWPERQSDHKPLYNVQETSGARVCSYFFKTAGGPRQRAPRATRGPRATRWRPLLYTISAVSLHSLHNLTLGPVSGLTLWRHRMNSLYHVEWCNVA